jgi:hypothetical protein
MEAHGELFKAMIGLSGQTIGCGAFCGAAAAIGLKYGLDRDEFALRPEVRFKIYNLVRKVKERFEKEYGSSVCQEIQQKLFHRTFDSTLPQDIEEFNKLGGSKICSKVTENAAAWAVEVILRSDERTD